MVIIPEALRRNTADTCGPEGVAWLGRLPEIIAAVEQEWSINVGTPFSRLSWNYAAPAMYLDGSTAVLKLFPPGDSELGAQAEALRLYEGSGITRLVQSNAELGALLLERAEPGIPLHTLRDEEQEMSVAAGIMKQLWRPVPKNSALPTVAEWGEAFARHRLAHGGGSGPLPAALFDRAESLHRESEAPGHEQMLLHGDFHHDNILAAQREPWLAIDPKGVVGDPAYELGPILRNFWEDLYEVRDQGAIVLRRVHLLQEHLGFTLERIREWALAGCVLSAVWSAEDHGTGWEAAIAVAETLAAM